MTGDALTIPCEGIGVWEGARVRAQTLRYGEVSCTVIRRTIGMAAGWWDVILDGLHVVSVHADDMRLDLTHRPTRLEALARLGARVGTDVGEGVLWFRMFARRTWMVDGVTGAPASWSPVEDGGASIVPALADLDPTDDTRLPDGARMVDVRALAIVLRQVFGGAR